MSSSQMLTASGVIPVWSQAAAIWTIEKTINANPLDLNQSDIDHRRTIKNLVTVSLVRDLVAIAIIATLAALSILTPPAAIVVGAILLASAILSSIAIGMSQHFISRFPADSENLAPQPAPSNNDDERKRALAVVLHKVQAALLKAVGQVQNSVNNPSEDIIAAYVAARGQMLSFIGSNMSNPDLKSESQTLSGYRSLILETDMDLAEKGIEVS